MIISIEKPAPIPKDVSKLIRYSIIKLLYLLLKGIGVLWGEMKGVDDSEADP